MIKKVAVLGCGPSGLIAAEAVRCAGQQVQIFSEKRKSPMPGAQYLHERIPGVTPYEPDGYVSILKEGDGKGYAEKVYGDPEAPVSWDHYEEGFYPAWSLAETYDRLWQRWEAKIIEAHVDRADLRFRLSQEYDVVLSTIPRRLLCWGGHMFEAAQVWFTDKCWNGCTENTVIYNGNPMIPWYRTSSLFGHDSTEYPEAVPNAERGFKPTTTDCNCLPKNVFGLGRFGKWDKQVLVHHAWKGAEDALLKVQ